MKESTAVENPVLKNDILRYSKNKFSARFALLALVFNILYFTLLYTIHTNNIYTVLLGATVIVNLLVLLAGFYASECVKAYKKFAPVFLFVLAGVQIARMFVYPIIGSNGNWLTGNVYFGATMSIGANIAMIIVYLALSAACFIVSGVFGLIYNKRLYSHLERVESGDTFVDDALKELEKQDDAAMNSVAENEAQDLADSENVVVATIEEGGDV